MSWLKEIAFCVFVADGAFGPASGILAFVVVGDGAVIVLRVVFAVVAATVIVVARASWRARRLKRLHCSE